MARSLTVRVIPQTSPLFQDEITRPPLNLDVYTHDPFFVANKKGKPFQFKLGSGEVIKGWDIGVAGMSVGGERRITVPAHLAYGSKSVPGIPPNSTLIFDIKCLEIS